MLNEQQKAIVNCDKKRVAVLAGAGTGKSTTLASRVRREIKRGVKPFNISIITFTNDACDSIYDKLIDKGVDADQMLIKTLHAFCLRIYYTYCDMNHKRRPKPISKPHKQFGFHFWKLASTYKLPNKNLNEYLSFIFDMQVEQKTPDMLLKELVEDSFDTIQDLQREMLNPKREINQRLSYLILIYHEYETWKKVSNMIDFTDMLTRAVKALKTCPKTLKIYQKKIKSLHVDESQDTNALVVELLKTLITDDMTVFFYGDYRQSIYSFLNASPKIIFEYLKENNFDNMPLNTNYRSSTQIVDNSNKFIANFPEVDIGGKLQCSKEPFKEIIGIPAYNEQEELYNNIQLLNDLRARGYAYKDIAFLYRTNAQAMLLLSHCIRNKIPFCVKSDSSSIFSKNEVKDYFAYLKIFNALDQVTVADLKRIANKPSRYVPNTAFNGLSDEGVGRRLIEGRLNYNDRLRAFHDSLAPHYHVARKLSLSDQIEYISNKVDYAGWWDKSEANDALFDLSIYTSTLSTLAKDFDTLPKLWKHIKEMKKAMKTKNSENGLRFSTIHGSKGLEFPVVSVIGVSSRLYPFYRAVEENGKEGYNEEARLFYVASTRAIKELYYFEICGKHGRTNVAPSPFIPLTNRVLKYEYPKEPLEGDNG